MRDVMLAVFPQVSPVRIDHRGSVEVHAGHVLFVDRNDDDHLVLCRKLLHQIESSVRRARARSVSYQRTFCSAQKYGP